MFIVSAPMASVLAWPPRPAAGCCHVAVPRAVFAFARDLSTSVEHASSRFTRASRLTQPTQYKQVFAGARRRGDRYFTILSIPNAHEQARLGMAVSRRNMPRAVDRNRIKRLIRESFRQHRADLSARDIVVLAKAPARHASNTELLEALSRHWQRLTTT